MAHRFTVALTLVASLVLLPGANAQDCAPAELPDVVADISLVSEVRNEHSVAAIYVGETEWSLITAERLFTRPWEGSDELWELLAPWFVTEYAYEGVCPYPCPLSEYLPNNVPWIGSRAPASDWEWYRHTDMVNGRQDIWLLKGSEPPIYLSNNYIGLYTENCDYSLMRAEVYGADEARPSDSDLVWREFLESLRGSIIPTKSRHR